MQQQEKHSQAMVLGLQHLLAMYSGSISCTNDDWESSRI